MNSRHVRHLLAKDLRLGPRSPLLLWALLLPIVLTVIVQGVIGGLNQEPRLGVVDDASYSWVEGLQGIQTQRVASEAALLALVRDGHVDAGIVISEAFTEALRAGETPPLDLRISGASSGSNRDIIVTGLLGATRELAGGGPPLTIEVRALGEPVAPLTARLLPLAVIVAVAVAGAMVPASSLVEERERATLDALLVSPVTTNDVLMAKGLLGGVLGLATGLVTLALNQAFGAQPSATVLGMIIGAVMMAEFGLLLGVRVPDTNTLFAAWKVGALLLIFPVIFFVWPGLPSWPARLGPTFYFLRPIFTVSSGQGTLNDVALDLTFGAFICIALLPAVAAAGRRLEAR